jgi:hypothetical protein
MINQLDGFLFCVILRSFFAAFTSEACFHNSAEGQVNLRASKALVDVTYSRV